MTTLEKIKAEILDYFLWDGQSVDTLPLYVRRVLNIIDKYAEQEPKWIPVSERLPEEDGLYLVYTEEQPFVCPFEDNGFFIDDVLAWMPLQEPYEKGGE